MKTLFAKILLWLLASSALAVIGFVAVSAHVGSGPRAHQPLLRALRFQAREAVHAYEEAGGPQLAGFLERMEGAYEFRGILTDAEGNALSGPQENLADLVARARRRLVFLDPSRRALVFTASAEGRRGSYWFFLLVPPRRFAFWFRFVESITWMHLWVLASIVLLSYALARHLTKPVLELAAAAERLGRGDFGARVRSNRQDELGELARTFDQMAERIEHAVTAQKQLLQDVSHELRSPLSRLGVAVELARSSPNPDEALDRVTREVERLNALVGELLEMSREQIRPAPIEVGALLADVVDEVQIEAQARNCRLLLDPAPEIEIGGDAKVLRRAVENVTRNAVHYTSPGTEVHVAARQSDGHVEIAVQDAGPGVPEESLPRLFDPFYRVARDRDRSTGGVGLGLSIARRAVELHGGRIFAMNTHPGLRVVIQLPLAGH